MKSRCVKIKCLYLNLFKYYLKCGHTLQNFQFCFFNKHIKIQIQNKEFHKEPIPLNISQNYVTNAKCIVQEQLE